MVIKEFKTFKQLPNSETILSTVKELKGRVTEIFMENKIDPHTYELELRASVPDKKDPLWYITLRAWKKAHRK